MLSATNQPSPISASGEPHGAAAESTTAPGPRLKPLNRTTTIAKLVLVPIALGVLVYILLGEVHEEPAQISVLPLLGGLCAAQLSFAVGAVRMWGVLRVFGIGLGMGFAQRLHLQSVFYGVFVPMSVGMEICRFVKIRARHPGTDAIALLTALLVDRLVGVIATLILVLATGWSLIVARGWLDGIDPMVGIGVAAAGAVLTLLALVIPRLRRMLRELAAATKGRRLQLLPMLVLSVLSLTLFAAAVWLVAIGLGIEKPLLAVVIGVSGGQLAQVIPISLFGAGAGEAAGAALFIAQGYEPGAAAVVVAVAYGLRLFGALEGGIIETVSDWRRLSQQRKATASQGKPLTI